MTKRSQLKQNIELFFDGFYYFIQEHKKALIYRALIHNEVAYYLELTKVIINR
ncbi:MAG: hypothetical protein KDI92_00580 [Xanthomonadales bacterium]|nr:hypothetical protein [Xanthomonadales bacterium]